VQPGAVRHRADEVTYDLHIIVRFELERALLADQLRISELPDAWAEAYQRYLGVKPRYDYEGCLQDGHWAEGLIGYFPTYTLGNIYAAQLFAAAESDIGPLDQAFARGDFSRLLGWLALNVHQHGRRYRVSELIERVTGNPPNAASLIAGLQSRYMSR
jgi:carboxypeptidase Taq